MTPFKTLTAIAAPLRGTDIDTDQIVPARFMHLPREHYGRFCFHDLRIDANGAPIAGFVLNQAKYAHAAVLVANRNFGCGSSREHAVYTLYDFGIRVIAAASFGDIFKANCYKNGLLALELDEAIIERWQAELDDSAGGVVAVDLSAQRVTGPSGDTHAFDIDPFSKHALLEGLDEIALTLRLAKDIEAYERDRIAPWPSP